MPRKTQTPEINLVETAEPVGSPVADDTVSSATTEAPYMEYAMPPARFETFEAFYPYYLGEHSQPWTRRLHVIGTGIAILFLANVVRGGVIDEFGSLIWAGIFGYGVAWAAHYFVEKNQPATFKYPAWSLMGDFKMFWEVVTRKRAW